MPTLDYICEDGHTYSEYRAMDDDDRTTNCPTCNKPLTRTYGVGAVTFKGKGFYTTDKRQATEKMRKFPKPCAECGTLSLETLCPAHLARAKQLHEIRRQQVKKQTGQYSGDYKRRAKQIRDTAITCHICGESARLYDPWQADHIDPANPLSELRAAHASCNRARGNKPIA